MGNTDGPDERVDDRREFIRRLRAHEDVRSVNFSRDGFQTVIVELASGAEFRDQWYQTANRLGYTVERIETDVSWSDRSVDAWVLRLVESEDVTNRPRWRSVIRIAGERMQAVIERLLGRLTR